MKFKLQARMAFPALFEAKTVNGEGEPAFSASFLVEDKNPTVRVLRDGKWVEDKLLNLIEEAGKEKWTTKWSTVKKEIEAKDRMPIHDGDLKSNYAGFPGNFYISARNKVKPSVFTHFQHDGRVCEMDARGNTFQRDEHGKLIPVTTDYQATVPYAGCYVAASLELWAQDNAYGKRINASLRGVQFVRDGEAFSGGGAASYDEFDAIDAEEPLV